MQGTVHMILQGKGGVGKSLVSALLAQYLKQREDSLYCADTDPVNQTFSRYSALDVDRIKIMAEENKINTRVFDELIEKLAEHEGNAVVDNGAATFVPLVGYLSESDILQDLQDEGKKVFVHTVVTGGQALDDTLAGLQALVNLLNARIIVWQNDYFGPVVKDGRSFVESELFKENISRIHGVVRLEARDHDTYMTDMRILAESHMTFAEAKASGKFCLAANKRLRQMKEDIFDKLDRLAI